MSTEFIGFTSQNFPTTLVVFGATGDLMQKKIVPALFHLYSKQKLPKLFQVIGVSRRDFSHEQFREFVRNILGEYGRGQTEKQIIHDFLTLFSYQKGDFGQKNDYRELGKRLGLVDKEWRVCANKLFYVAAPPQFYETIFTNLAVSGLTRPCSPEEGWTRVIVEKPFGKDLKTAQELEKLSASLFQEVQIYRIDHYLAKEMVQNILAFRFSNNLFEKTWDRDSIEKIGIKLWEKIGVEDRGSFYDGLGALRDVGQNHLLQILALLAMKHPINFSAQSIREKRAAILKNLITPSKEEIEEFTFRAQYYGYQGIKGVVSGSTTETYFKTRAFLAHPNWLGVPFILESGKRLKEQIKEAVITFRHTMPCLCPPGKDIHYRNKITISLEPEEKITLAFWSKKPGLEFELQERDFSLLMREAGKKTQYTEEYEKLLYDCITGDQTLFVTSGEVEAMWKYTDPIIEAWQKNVVPLKTYKPDTEEPIIASSWINEGGTLIKDKIKKEIGIVGLGKMGANLARRLIGKGWQVVGFNRTLEVTKELENEGLKGAYSIDELVRKLSPPRIIWLMVPAGKPVDDMIFGEDGLIHFLQKGDIIVDGGNSYYKDSLERYKKLKEIGLQFVDVGVSGGPEGALKGASLMIGGGKQFFDYLEPLFSDLAYQDGYQFFEGAGAGHFVKMVHNGIEYGMMQAIAEGFTVLKKVNYRLDLTRVADVYNHGSVIESRLVAWLKKAFELHGQELEDIKCSVEHTGEGKWTVKTAKELMTETKIIEEALKFRINSEKNPSYTGKILSALREQFGGHSVKN